MIEVKSCPICGHQEYKEVLKAPFFRGKKVSFSIQECCKCALWFTSPRPADEDLGAYYEQENYASHSDKGTSLFDQAYKTVRSIALKSKVKLVKKYAPKNSLVLDYGAGGGAFVAALEQAGFNARGVEPSEIARANAKEVHGLSLLNTNQFEASAETYSAISLWHVLEHLPDLHDKMGAFHKALKPGGVLIIAVPNHESYDAKLYKEAWAALDVPLHLYHFKKKNIEELAKAHQFELMQIKNMPFDSFYVSLLSEKIMERNSSVSAIKTGLVSNLKAGKDNASSLIYVLRKEA
jgi:2-polyprenyl-3-methyl-5-hydroxy-6-metoxy-1,4-benzoquinol methylase